MIEKIGSITSMVVARAQFSENLPVASIKLWSLINTGLYSTDTILNANAVVSFFKSIGVFIKLVRAQSSKMYGISNILLSNLEILKTIHYFFIATFGVNK